MDGFPRLSASAESEKDQVIFTYGHKKIKAKEFPLRLRRAYVSTAANIEPKYTMTYFNCIPRRWVKFRKIYPCMTIHTLKEIIGQEF